MNEDNFPGITEVETVCGTGSKSVVVVTNKNDHTTSCTDRFL